MIIYQDDEIDAQRPAPTDHDLAVHQPVVDAAEHDRHQGVPIALPPASAARAAASPAERSRWKTKSTSMARLTPVTTFTDGHRSQPVEHGEEAGAAGQVDEDHRR